MKSKYAVALLLIIGLLSYQAVYSAERETPNQPTVKNIIFMIGDGMGASQVYAGMNKKAGGLALERASYSGFSKTYSANDYITDSAAGGTALACGVKTANGMIGMDRQGNIHKSMLTLAAEKGMKTGVVVTSSVTDATPASFLAHQRKRSMHEEIAMDILKSDVDVLIGGGRQYFEKRNDKLNLMVQLKEKGYHTPVSLDEIKAVTTGKIAALVAEGNLPFYSTRGDVLPQYVEKAIQLLDNKEQGFFLMVEGSQIDFCGHRNEGAEMVNEMIDFDNAVKVAFDYADKHPNTLVIVTADHETGGAYLTDGNIDTGEVKVKFGTKGHTGVMVPVFSYGAQAHLFSGIQDNTSFFPKILERLGIAE